MQALRAQAEKDSGVSYAAVERARGANLYAKLGAATLARLSEAFYARVYADAPWFRGLFGNTTRAAAERNQREFLGQEFGGPRLYEARKGHTALLGRHGPYAVDARAAARWLLHMQAAVEEVGVGEWEPVLMDYFRFMAWFVVRGTELVNGARTVGYHGRHEEGSV